MAAVTTRDQILLAAIDVYQDRGQAGFSMRTVAGRAGLTATAIYRHFDDKRELVRAITDWARERLSLFLLEASASGTSSERLWNCGAGYLRFACETPQLYRLLFVDPMEDDLPQFPEGASEDRTPPFLLIVDRVRECMAEGELRRADPVSVTLTVWALVHGLCMLWISQRVDKEQLEVLYRESLERLLDGLKP